MARERAGAAGAAGAAVRDLPISPDVAAVLRRSTVTAGSITLPERLDRELYQRVNKILVAAGGRWSQREKTHLFAEDPRVRLGSVLAGAVEDPTQPADTPPAIAELVATLADVKGRFVHDPIAGRGALADAAVLAGAARVVCLEPEATAVDDLRARGYIAAVGDFLKTEPPDHMLKYDRIVMHPPALPGRPYVVHALRFLAPRGRLVAIVPKERHAVDLGPGYDVTQLDLPTAPGPMSVIVVKPR